MGSGLVLMRARPLDAALLVAALTFHLPARQAADWVGESVATVAPPSVRQENWLRDELDRFVLRQLEDTGKPPSLFADGRTLARRLAFDLTGLTPSSRQVQRFVEDVVHVRDLHATILHLLGIDHQRLSVPFQGLDVRLTGVEQARPIHQILTGLTAGVRHVTTSA